MLIKYCYNSYLNAGRVTFFQHIYVYPTQSKMSGRRGRMVVGFATTYAISAYHYEYVEPESRSWRGLLDTTCDIIMTERR